MRQKNEARKNMTTNLDIYLISAATTVMWFAFVWWNQRRAEK